MTATTAEVPASTPCTVALERASILEFAETTGSTHRTYRDAELPVVPPTYLCLERFADTAPSPAGDGPVERDCRFFGLPPHAGDRLIMTSRGNDADRLTEFRDADGRLVADAWTHGDGADSTAADRLAGYATDWLGPESVRRFRTRSVGAVPEGETLACTGAVVQEYIADGERRVDVALTAIRPTGQVAARAWATFARAD
ncbi:hypothetical protein FK531_00675 [Rhodococcus spelaei]|uniref:N-terminal of MaoC-like dehydratase domain-containing protein n=1 Tax=Rhodococcus spelaei TaxID=2546320 RepID=A0A541BQR6_9NOCA|nr:hypothetical protein [Rhodococcus spelaei]TQF74654.1 hypothetical protein FK531_00675 [Rhodococcus spelaei]